MLQFTGQLSMEALSLRSHHFIIFDMCGRYYQYCTSREAIVESLKRGANNDVSVRVDVSVYLGPLVPPQNSYESIFYILILTQNFPILFTVRFRFGDRELCAGEVATAIAKRYQYAIRYTVTHTAA